MQFIFIISDSTEDSPKPPIPARDPKPPAKPVRDPIPRPAPRKKSVYNVRDKPCKCILTIIKITQHWQLISY